MPPLLHLYLLCGIWGISPQSITFNTHPFLLPGQQDQEGSSVAREGVRYMLGYAAEMRELGLPGHPGLFHCSAAPQAGLLLSTQESASVKPSK